MQGVLELSEKSNSEFDYKQQQLSECKMNIICGEINRIVDLFYRIGLSKEQINRIMRNINFYWSRDNETRLDMVHFLRVRIVFTMIIVK